MQIKFGLIGHPIKHSMSPALFKAGYDGRYPYELIEGSDFEESYRIFLEEYYGINVTAPFKELAFAKADLLSDECRIIRATNLLVKTPEGVKAYNSDYLGVRMWLQEVTAGSVPGVGATKSTPPTSWAPPPAARGIARFSFAPAPVIEPDKITVLICGCGGAGKAAAVAAASLGMNVILMNRDCSKAEAVAASISQMAQAGPVQVRPMEEFRKYFKESDILIYNIPTAIPGLEQLTDEDFMGRDSHCGKLQTKNILEANYKDPSFNKILTDRALEANPEIRFTKGSTWLLYQAVTGYEIFTGEKPDLGQMSAVI